MAQRLSRPKFLNETSARELVQYLGDCRERLRLQHWGIIILLDPVEDVEGNEDNLASILTHENHHSARLAITKRWTALPAEAKRNTIIHELCHLYHDDIGVLWRDVTYGNTAMSTQRGIEYNASFDVLMERMVSDVTRALERYFPVYPGEPGRDCVDIVFQETY